MSRKFVYRDANGEKVKLPGVTNVEEQREFYKVTYTPLFGSEKTSMVKKNRVIRYDV